MSNSSKRKGDKAELEVERIIGDLLGLPIRRKLGAGRKDDMGDIDGIADHAISVANWPSDTLRACRDKPIELEEQRLRSGCTFAATFVRFRGGRYRVVLTPEQWATYVREAL